MSRKSLMLKPRTEPDQLDLFIYDIQDVSIKDSRETMVYPFLSLSKTPRFEPIDYSVTRKNKLGETRTDMVKVTGAKPFGIATIWDFDIMLWIFGQIAALINDGEEPSQRFGFHAYDCMKAIQRTSGKQGNRAGGSDYRQFEAALRRLRSTQIHTNIAEGNLSQSVGWFEDLTIHRDDNNRITQVEVKLHDWIYSRVTNPKNILTINQDYFRLTSGIARQLYRVARKMAGERLFSITLDDLTERSGTADKYQFKKAIKNIIEIAASGEEFPDYDIVLHERKGREHVTFIKRKPRAPKPLPARTGSHRHMFQIDDDSRDQAKRLCRDFELDFEYWWSSWTEKQWTKHMDFIVQHGRPPLKHPGKAFLGYLRKVAQNQKAGTGRFD